MKFMRYIYIIILNLLLYTNSYAHRPNIKTNLVRFDTTIGTSFVEIRPQLPGKITLRMTSPPKNGYIKILFRSNSSNGEVIYNLDSNGSDLQSFNLNIDSKEQTKIEINTIEVYDSTNNLIASVGGRITGTKPVFTWPLVYVIDSVSNNCFTRGGDTFLFPNGKWTVGFDALRVCGTDIHLNSVGNYAEIEYSINNGPWIIDNIFFDTQSGKSKPNGRPGKYLKFNPLDTVRIKRVDVFDSHGNKFATMGVRMGSQGHYRE